MKTLWIVILALSFLGGETLFSAEAGALKTGSGAPGLGNPKKPPVRSSKRKKGAKKVRSKRAIASEKRVGSNARVHRYRANLALGMNVVKGASALAIGGQFGYAYWDRVPAYIGPDISFAVDAPQSLFQFLVGGWYQLGIYRTPRMYLTGGFLAGLAIPYSHNVVRSTTLAYYLDFTISQEIDDLVSIRGQFRPGFVGQNFALMMNFNVGFRFP